MIVIFSICCHEYAHAQIALWQGDSTAYENGHLTLNPFKQMGVISIITLLIIGISWGAVPVNPNRMKHKYSEALVAFAGPFTNLFLFFIFSIVSAVVMLKGTPHSDITYNLVYVDMENFERYKPASFRQLTEIFQEFQLGK